MQITYQKLDYNNTDEINTAAKIHEESPLNWDSSWKVTDDGIAQWVKRINDSKNTNIMFLLFAKLPDGEIVGFHWLRLYEKNNEQLVNVDSLWVSEKCRGNGIASTLKSLGEDWAKHMKVKAITTNVFYDNKKMLNLNLKLGFKTETVKMSKRL